MKILITGAAGFIGFHLCNKLIKSKYSILGIDNFNNYYDENLKKSRANFLNKESKKFNAKFKLKKIDITNQKKLKNIFDKFCPTHIVHLAAQAGVRYSLKNSYEYINSNIVGFNNILENCKELETKHFVYASTSSVYGGNITLPFQETQSVDHPINIYSATKKANELIAHSYSHLYKIPCTGVRFFTVYGPWGRPDMALFKFVDSILNNQPIDIYGNGQMIRDFTFIDDIIEGLIRLIKKPPNKNNNFDKHNPTPNLSWAPYRIFNMGNSQKIILDEYVNAIEDSLKIKAIRNYLPVQPGEMFATESDNTLLKDWINFIPKTPINEGVKKFVDWYKYFYLN